MGGCWCLQCVCSCGDSTACYPHCMTLVWRPLHALFEPACPSDAAGLANECLSASVPCRSPLPHRQLLWSPFAATSPSLVQPLPATTPLPCSLGLFLPCSYSHQPTRLVRGA
ncbi:hypothetical protein PAPYR_5534 [Paratrimastix pyriformis]|uniref:Secreted protein n=1 Tax=Paratrimastix pyriformis TaxID=342808 RepID=A0ABQ8UID8_9EUKA|nr:hypothetical protein PAPYR_5534 [Paratrimastix pyriformis]